MPRLMPTRTTIRKIQTRLLAWYHREKRDLPWRRTSDPYHILVSEVMLQQTQVVTVIPYYEKWIESFPTVASLAKASEGKVLKHWEGLGYYSRARNLHKAAKEIHQQFAGHVPESREDILKLPGIGKYTAGAILSIAFNQDTGVLDGNVKRVLSRLFRLKENGASPASVKILWDLADKMPPSGKAGDFNQAIMELGATVCLPKNPLCEQCPLNKICEAWKCEEVHRFPPAKNKTPTRKIEVSAGVIFRKGKTFIQQRPHKGLMGGLWEFPGGKLEKNELPEQALLREIREELGVRIEVGAKILTIKHSYTKFRVTLHVFLCTCQKAESRPLPANNGNG